MAIPYLYLCRYLCMHAWCVHLHGGTNISTDYTLLHFHLNNFLFCICLNFCIRIRLEPCFVHGGLLVGRGGLG